MLKRIAYQAVTTAIMFGGIYFGDKLVKYVRSEREKADFATRVKNEIKKELIRRGLSEIYTVDDAIEKDFIVIKINTKAMEN